MTSITEISNEILFSIIGAIFLLTIIYLIFRLTKAEKKKKRIGRQVSAIRKQNQQIGVANT